ncbi:methyltransferase [Pseudosulfitobacter koreensis]|uniref:Methyltransferase domain-containing protein n=1 Tax=Pseudosulfitobacter koreensis TaxID=2968472 RepID=A0ABT1YWF2_9RHOB|nr:methyltransferase [Pseudosulfitobacter koreense]MCR8825224.1 methyltransferase domain-containing protein [Pseudosulfitobacter koreense]
MTDVPADMPVARGRGNSGGFAGWNARLIASRRFQKWAAGSFLTRRIVRREGEALFDLLAGFCHSQILSALVQFEMPGKLMNAPMTAEELSVQCNVPLDRMVILVRAATALGLLKRKRGGKIGLTRRSAALVGVPGLQAMIRHHDILYRDLADPAAFFRGETETELASFWPYVFGGDMEPRAAAAYSDLMAQSLELVADDTLRSVDLSNVKTLLDVGGGSGAFLAAAGREFPHLNLMLFDLPEVAPSAQPRFERAGVAGRSTILGGSFLNDPIPSGADAISLIRVLYDHSDSTVTALLAKCFDALPAGGRLIISEPMLGGDVPERAGDVYFALYTLAMKTGKTRSLLEIKALCEAAGFEISASPAPFRPFITRCLEARKRL